MLSDPSSGAPQRHSLLKGDPGGGVQQVLGTRWLSTSSAAGVEPATLTRVTTAGALHHAAALLTGRAEVETPAERRQYRRLIGQRRGRRCRLAGVGFGPGTGRAGRTAVSALGWAGRVAQVRAGSILGRLARANLLGEDPELLLQIDVH